MKTTMRQHPIAIFRYIGKYLFLLLIPLLRGFLLALSGGFIAWFENAWLDILTIISIIFFSTLRWYCVTITNHEDNLEIKSGFIFIKHFSIKKSNITTMCIIENIYLKPIRAVKLKIDSPAGSFKAPDTILILSSKDAQIVIKNQSFFLDCKNINISYLPRNFSLVALSAISSNSFAGVLIMSTLVIQLGEVFGRDFSEQIYWGLEEVSEKIAYGLPPLAVALALITILGWFFTFVGNIFRHFKMEIKFSKKIIEITGGLFTKRRYLLQRELLTCIDIRQTLFTKILGVACVFADTIGYGKEKDDLSAVIPLSSYKKLHSEFEISFPEFKFSERTLRPSLTSIIKFTYIPLLSITSIPCFVHALSRIVPNFSQTFKLLGIMSVVPLTWLLSVNIFDLFSSGISKEGNCFTFRYSKGFSFHTIVIPENKVVFLRLRTSIFQRFFNKCDVFAYSYSESEKSHRIKNLKRDEVCKFFGI